MPTFEENLAKLEGFKLLKKGWNGHLDPPPEHEAIDKAALVLQILHERYPQLLKTRISVYPTCTGDVGIDIGKFSFVVVDSKGSISGSLDFGFDKIDSGFYNLVDSLVEYII